jgi:signal transduction histidine kinase/CheY-like chemotaxis protein
MVRSAEQGLISRVLRTIFGRELIPDLLVFSSYLATAKLAQYILFTLQTSPALIWAPTGIALAAVLLKGNKMWVPVCAAYVVALVTLPNYLPPWNIAIATAGFTLQPLIGAWLFRKMGSNGTLHRSRDVLVLLGGAAFTAAIGPLFNTVGQIMLGVLAETVFITFSRAWAGGVLGILVVTPFITGWYYSWSWPITREQRAEAVSAFGLLILSIYLLFWVSFPSIVFLLIFLLCVVLFWISFRFGSRVNTTAILLLTALGIMGSIVAHPSSVPLSSQLFADELFLLLIAPIFFQFFVLAEERRQAANRLTAQISELERITTQLAANDAAKNEFIAMLAHELRNPLSTVVSTLELLKLESGANAQIISRAEQQTFAMRRLLDDLLDVARINEKKIEVIPEPTDLAELIRVSVETTEPHRKAKNHTLTMWLPERPVRLMLDPVRLEQVITNILNNAAKYSRPGSAIEILCTTEDRQLRIAIKDNGDGIPPDRLEEIFSPFQQLAPAPHRSAGIGIGLFLARQIVEMHGGTITAHSWGEGTGSTFTILLPLIHARDEDTPTSSILPARSHAAKRILVVDDNEAAALGMQRLLEHHGHMVTAVHDGKSALAALHDLIPEVILLDIGLPDMSGHDVARKIRAHGGVQPILIALTGYGQEEDKSEALVSGFNHHLTKPVSINEVLAILNP